MAHQHHPNLQPEKLNIGPVAARLGFPALLVGIVALVISLWLGTKSDELKNHLLHSYLTAYCFFMAITLGCILFVLIHYATRAGWSTTVRRLAEGLAQNIFLMIILFIPILANAPKVLEWLAIYPNEFYKDQVLAAKSGYMNPTFLFIRLAAYFVIFAFIAAYYRARSVQQDNTGDPKITSHLERISYPLIIIMGFSLTGFAFDWIMGLNPHWFSTIFGVYYFAGCMLAAFASITLLGLSLQKRGLIGPVVNHDHYHDLGKWMFAFTVFWAYIGFSQYVLIWYSNIPEETQFYIPRQIGIWASISLMLLAVHFIIPFLGMLSRHVKRKNGIVAFWAVWSLLACALDQFYLVLPNEWTRDISKVVDPNKPYAAHTESLPQLVDMHNVHVLREKFSAFNDQINFAFTPQGIIITALCFIGIGGLFVFFTMMSLKGKSLVPTKDPKLEESLAFENV